MEFIGLYPTWFEPSLGSGWVVGIIATAHVLFSHTSVGAAIFFAFLATLAYQRNRPELLTFVKQYGLFLLVFAYVAGSITGVGIWYSTTVASPRGISALIHSFVWKWATEWVFFVIEVVGVYLVVYLVGKVDPRTHLRVTWIFALSSLATMLIIIGILSFMLWPGKEIWFDEGGYLNGFYGPNTFAQLAMRMAFMLTMTAVVGGVVASRIQDLALRREITRMLAWLGIVSAVVGTALFSWYTSTLPEHAHLVMQARLPDWFSISLIAVLGGIIVYFIATLLVPRMLTPAVAGVATVAILVFGLWPEEVARESIRKPFVAGEYLYSNQVIARDVPGMGIRSEIPVIQEHGLLKTHVFLPEGLREVAPDNAAQVGHAIALSMCSNCHSVTDTGMRPIRNYLGGSTDVARIKTYLLGALATGNTLYMPQIPMTDDEAEALAVFLASLNDPELPLRYAQERAGIARSDDAATTSKE
ncbi:cytochrome c family protein [Thioalkalivibrio nitratireducens DSM 14787]|uniref:Cytochrome c family protein n=1 Tax=Thioalkalivibrio nitratireducens (strain DSM 14787 / UNIQEM 213 / ALEN2) TaxID=1255043 RepID=L0E2A5_THIND|nr:cytochrome ubiquinol oxidase subunit I [Thioalkalivibrio nitratireducens]AGA35413.1 cytochrome c family protein [Thioalkalivibrio nitratireducens DSM 14787]